jgi:hypothetical protein
MGFMNFHVKHEMLKCKLRAVRENKKRSLLPNIMMLLILGL